MPYRRTNFVTDNRGAYGSVPSRGDFYKKDVRNDRPLPKPVRHRRGWESSPWSNPRGEDYYQQRDRLQERRGSGKIPLTRGNVLGAALRHDMGKLQQYADEQFERNNQQIDKMDAVVEGFDDRILGQARQAEDRLAAQADGMEDRADAAVGQMREAVDPYLDTASNYYDQAVEGYEDRTAQDTSAAMVGLQQQLQNQMTQIDGDASLTPSQKQQMKMQLQGQMGMLRQQTANQIASGYNQGMAQMQMAAGQGYQGSAQISAQATAQGQGVANQRLQMSQAYNQMRESLASNAAQVAAQLAMQGRTTVAQFVQQNPRSHVSWFQGLAALAAANKGNIPMSALPGEAEGAGSSGLVG